MYAESDEPEYRVHFESILLLGQPLEELSRQKHGCEVFPFTSNE